MIDDDASLLKIYTRILGKHGYQAYTAENGREALEKLKKQRYDAILIDVRLPDVNGIELLQRIHAQTPEAVKIIVTGFPSPEDRTRALSSGATAYLGKPVRTEELLKILDDKLKPAQKKTSNPPTGENR